MKILVIGSGGREHALVWKLAQSERVSKIFCAPGNPGTAKLAKNIPIKPDQLDKLVKFVKKEKVNLTVVGPEVPLISGIVDLFNKNHLNIFGPTEKAARIEGSKVFAKKLMLKYGIPSAKFAVFDDYAYAKTFLKSQKYPLVIKADGQCLGKGVMVCQNEKSAQGFLKLLMVDKTFGPSGNKIIIEECLTGQEVSFMVVTDGKDFVSLLPSQDHKPVFDGDRGPNTGGMGAYAPVPFADKKLISRIEKEIVGPTISAMAKEDCLYKGILYPGLILTKDGPKVLEYNCRFGDPETQPVIMLLKTDIMEIFEAVIKNKVKNLKIQWFGGSAVCVVLTSKGYPGNYEKRKVIVGLPNINKQTNLQAFQAGTKIDEGKVVTSGGRVLGITGREKDLQSAIKKVYNAIGKNGIHFSEMHYRIDIGQKGLKKKLWN